MLNSALLHAGDSLNASSGLVTGTESMGSLVLMVAWIALIAVALFAVRSSRHFDKLANAAKLFAVSLFYAVHGLAAITAAAVAIAPVYLFAQAEPGTRSAVGVGVVVAVGGYAALTALGYVFRHWVVEPADENLREHLDAGPEVADGE